MWLKVYRLLFVIVSCSLMTIRTSTPDAYFTGLLIFSAGLFYDYCSIHRVGKIESDKYHSRLGIWGGILGFINIVVSLLGLNHVIDIQKVGNNTLITNGADCMINFGFTVYILLGALFIFTFLAGFEIYGEHRRTTRAQVTNTTNAAV